MWSHIGKVRCGKRRVCGDNVTVASSEVFCHEFKAVHGDKRTVNIYYFLCWFRPSEGLLWIAKNAYD